MKIKINHINSKVDADGVKTLYREDFACLDECVTFYRDHEYQFVADDICKCTEEEIEADKVCTCVKDDDVLKIIDSSPTHVLGKWYDLRFSLFQVI